MSMWRTSVYRSPCEVLREINDLFQGDTEKDKAVRRLLAECEEMSKQMSIDLHEFRHNYYKGWKTNRDSGKDATFRTGGEYKYHKI